MPVELPREYLTKRLRLRPLSHADVDAVFAYASQPSYSEFLDLPRPYERRHAEEYVANCLRDNWAKEPTFALELAGVVIGAISICVDNATWANLGYGLSHEHWGKGLVVEAARPLVTDLFARVDLARVEISAALPNYPSWRVAEKLGLGWRAPSGAGWRSGRNATTACTTASCPRSGRGSRSRPLDAAVRRASAIVFVHCIPLSNDGIA